MRKSAKYLIYAGLSALIGVTDVFQANSTAYAVYEESELVNLNDMRSARQKLHFVKMQATGNDYILIDALKGRV